MTERCKRNPCCADYLNCKEPPQFLPREGYEAYRRRIGREPKEAAMASEMPERMFAGSYSALGAPDTGYWHPVETPSTGTEYVLASTHQRALEALREARAAVQALVGKNAAEIDDCEASMAKQYYHGKERGLTEALARIDAALTRIKEK